MATKSTDSPGITFLTKWWFENGRDAAEAPRVTWERELLPRYINGLDLYLEIGVCEGHSMRWVLENLHPRKAIGIDPYLPKKPKLAGESAQHRRNMLANLQEWLRTGQCQIYEERSQQFLKICDEAIPDGSVDLAFVDGDHNALPTLTDCILVWPKIKAGGIMMMDDYNRRWQLGRPMAKEGIDAFLEAAESRYDWEWGPTRKLWTTQVAIRKLK